MNTQELRLTTLFRDLTDEEFGHLAGGFREISLPPNHLVFREGATTEAFYVLRRGEVVIFRDLKGKPVQLLARLGPNDFCGEFSLYTGEHTASARTTALSDLFRLAKPDLLSFLAEHPSAALKLQRAVARQLNIHTAKVREHGQRHEVRVPIDRRVVLKLDDGSLRTATVNDLSPGGLSLSGGPAGWCAQDAVSFELGIQGFPLRCTGRIAWMRGALVGIAFTEKPNDHERNIHRAVMHLLDPAGAAGPHSRERWAS